MYTNTHPTPAKPAKPVNRWTSRKFLMALAAQATAIAVLIWPHHQSAVVEASQSITSLLVLLLTSLGYVHQEASLDRQRVRGGKDGEEEASHA